MLRIPLKSLASRHLFRIPALDKAGIRPAGCADENFSGFCLARRSFGHASTKSHAAANANKIAISPLTAAERMLFRFAQRRYRNYSQNAGWSSLVARQAHNLKVAGSNPAPATTPHRGKSGVFRGRTAEGQCDHLRQKRTKTLEFMRENADKNRAQ